MRLTEVSLLVCLAYGDLRSSPSKSDLQDSASVASSCFLVQQFSGAAVKLGFDFFGRSTPPKTSIPGSIDALWEGATFYASSFPKIKNFLETLISFGEREGFFTL